MKNISYMNTYNQKHGILEIIFKTCSAFYILLLELHVKYIHFSRPVLSIV